MSVRNYHSVLRNIPKEHSYQECFNVSAGGTHVYRLQIMKILLHQIKQLNKI